MQNEDYHMPNSFVNYSDAVKNEINSSLAQIIKGLDGGSLIEVAPDNNLKSEGILKGDGIIIDLGETAPHYGGDSYLIKGASSNDNYKNLCRLILLPGGQYSIGADLHTHESSLDGIEVIGKVVGKITVRKH